MKPDTTQSRRQFIGKTAAAVAGLAAGSHVTFGAPAIVKNLFKPNSNFDGVQIGVIAPYSFKQMPSDAESLLKNIVELGINAVEMQNGPVEQFAGAPQAPAGGGGGGRAGGPAPEPTAAQLAQQKAQQDARAKELATWRANVKMDKFVALRKMYNDKGVNFYAWKLALTDTMTDAEYNYAFNVAKALGATSVTMEMPRTDDTGQLTNRIGKFAAQHKILVAYHAHLQANINLWDRAVWQSEYNGLNTDIGHYMSGTNESAIPLLDKHWTKIGSIHLKDRLKDQGPNVPWGYGNTPIKETLQHMKTKKATFPGTIELEYAIPAGSDSVKEIAKCLDYAKRSIIA